MLNISGFTSLAAEAVARASRSKWLKSIENIGSDTVLAIFERNGKKVERFIESSGRFCNNTYELAPYTKRTKTVFSTLNYFGDRKTHISCHDFVSGKYKEIIK